MILNNFNDCHLSLFCIVPVCQTLLSGLSHVFFTATVHNNCYIYPYFTDKEIEAEGLSNLPKITQIF